MTPARRPARTRPPAVAGTFYPADPDTLRALIAECFADARATPGSDDTGSNDTGSNDTGSNDTGSNATGSNDTGSNATGTRPAPKGLVVPHAGLIYSGPIAASAYLRLAPVRSEIRRVVLIGPSHRVPLRGLAVSGADAFATPLGVIPVDVQACAALASLPGVGVADGPHRSEHSLEVQLPFLQTVLDDFELVPVVAGVCDPEEVVGVLDACWGGAETVIVLSTDLSHYHPYGEAVTLDRRTAAAILSGRPEAIGDLDACGAYGLRGLLRAAGSRDLSMTLIDLRNSGDTAGDLDRVVGYGAFALA